MNTKLLIGGVVIVAGIIVGAIVFNSSPPTNNPPIIAQEQKQAQPIINRYVVYSPSTFNATKDKKRVLYFHAPWCPICRPTDKEFTQKSDQIPTDVVVLKTDYDSSADLKKKYAVTYQHTFVLVDANGNEVTKWNGGGLAEVIEKTR